jgi:IS1 family transposase/transposase-like protein
VKQDKAAYCPYCLSVKVVRNGIKPTGRQHFKCKQCTKQFQREYLYRGADKHVKNKVIQMLLRGSGIRDTALVQGVSPSTVLRCLINESMHVIVKPQKRYYPKVQIDELWMYVTSKKKKVWLLYAYCYETDEILAFTMGKRNSKTLHNLLLKLKALEIDWYLTDKWEAFSAELPYYQHLIGKQFTKAIEGVNTWFRVRIRRLNRRTTCFSKKLIYLYATIKTAIAKRNQHSSYI